MIKLELQNETTEKGRLRIIYKHSSTTRTNEKYIECIKPFIVEDFAFFLNNDILERNIKLFIETVGLDIVWTNDDKTSMAEESRLMIEKILNQSIAEDFHQTAYIIDKIISIKETGDISINDIKNIFILNDELSRTIFSYVRWVEKKMKNTLKWLIESNHIKLWELKDNDLRKNKSFKDTEKAIKKYVNDATWTNSHVLASMSFHEKLGLLKCLNIDNKDKMFLFSREKIPEEADSNNKWTLLLSLLQIINSFRNRISHGEFLLNKKTISELKMLFTKIDNDGYMLCYESNNHKVEMEEQIVKSINKLIDLTNEEYKKNKIKEYFYKLIN